jgi:hypothetical protein
MLKALEKQLVSLRKTCDGDTAHPCAILEAFLSAARAGPSAPDAKAK